MTVGIEFKGAYLLGIYAVAGVVFLIAAYQLYKWRKLETAGDLISMRGIKPVFRWGVAVCAGLLGGTAVADTIGNSFSSAKVHFWILAAGTLIFGAIGFFVAEMLIEKNFPHHGAVAFGHYGKALYEVFKYLGIPVEDINFNQPKGMLYPTENPFC